MSDANHASNGTEQLERPFPWPCPRCGKKEVRRTVLPYEFEEEYQGRTVHLVIPDFAVPLCEACGEWLFDYTAEAQINETLRDLISKGTDLGLNHSAGITSTING